MQDKGELVIAGGGTGGHIYPALAVADEWTARHPGWHITFMGTPAGMEKDIIPREGYDLKVVKGMGIMGRSAANKIRGLFAALTGFFQSVRFLFSLKPAAVIGTGGYASGPPVMAAAVLGIPTLIHEENTRLGTANRLLKPFVEKVTVAFRETLESAGKKAVHTGNPVRVTFTGTMERKTDGKFRVLIFGGSRGAESINKTAAEALPLLEEYKDRIAFIHQKGRGKSQGLEKTYEGHGLEAEVRDYIYNMEKAYSRADLVVCRAGATTLSELTALGMASILIPFPHSTGGHQEDNAWTMERAGAAIAIEEKHLNGEILALNIIKLMENPFLLKTMKQKSSMLGRRDAAGRVVKTIEEVIQSCTEA